MLEVSSLRVNYGDIPVLWGIDLSVTRGEIVSLIGSNGMGKTTLIRTISGQIRTVEGKITFNEEEIQDRKPRHIVSKGISQVPEGRKLFPGMTVRENLKMGAYARTDSDRIEEDLGWVFQMFPVLKEREKQVAGTLSGGEQQMCAIGRGLMSRPQLLMIDELSLGLAPMLVDSLVAAIHDINRTGVAVMLVEQDVQIALENSNRGYVIETGRILLSGDSKELLSDPGIKKTYLGI
jgi:branched-chain amino acid transport system ATP-binding protein